MTEKKGARDDKRENAGEPLAGRYGAVYLPAFFIFPLAFSEKMVYTISVPAGVMELVDVVDSKSTDGDIVPVRVRPPAPKTASFGLPFFMPNSPVALATAKRGFNPSVKNQRFLPAPLSREPRTWADNCFR